MGQQQATEDEFRRRLIQLGKTVDEIHAHHHNDCEGIIIILLIILLIQGC